MRLTLKYVQEVQSGGRSYFYYRRDGRRIRIDGEPGTSKFIENYQQINATFKRPALVVAEGTMNALIAEYRQSADYLGTEPTTKKTYNTYLERVREAFGPDPVASIRRKHILRLRDKYSAKPAACNSIIRLVAKLMAFAVERDWIEHSPATRIKNLPTGEHQPWSDEEVEAFLANATPDLAHVVAIGVYTGQRFGDCIKMLWSDFRDGGVYVKQQKTGAELWIPMHPDLAAWMAKIPRNGVTILTDKAGRSWTHDRFQSRFRTECNRLGMDVTFHGLRKTAAVRLAEAGCTNEETKAITGHKSDQVLAHYTKGARQKKLASAAIAKLTENRSGKT